MLNRIVVHGRLTKDPELRYTQSETAVASFTVAVDRDTRDSQADFFNCVAWRETGVFIDKYFRKGQEILIEGRLQTREWTDKNGNKRLAYEINVNKADFCGSRRDNEQNYTEYPGAGNDNPFIDGGDGDGDLPF